MRIGAKIGIALGLIALAGVAAIIWFVTGYLERTELEARCEAYAESRLEEEERQRQKLCQRDCEDPRIAMSMAKFFGLRHEKMCIEAGGPVELKDNWWVSEFNPLKLWTNGSDTLTRRFNENGAIECHLQLDDSFTLISEDTGYYRARGSFSGMAYSNRDKLVIELEAYGRRTETKRFDFPGALKELGSQVALVMDLGRQSQPGDLIGHITTIDDLHTLSVNYRGDRVISTSLGKEPAHRFTRCTHQIQNPDEWTVF